MAKIRPIRLLLAVGLALLFSLSANAQHAKPRAAEGPYVDVLTYLPAGHVDAWLSLKWKLKRNFDDICGDTFCEGEFSNIEALRYNCSVDRTSGRIGMCAWTFAASNEEVDPVDGSIIVEKGFWRCRTPLAPNTTIEQLMTALAGNRPMFAPLPASSRTIMDGLVDDCFF